MILSIVVPIYNVEECLARCLDSFQNNQHKNDFEVIMVDDGSSDKSGEIADKYSSIYGNYHSFHKENGGLSDARNYGLSKSTGDYVWFVDSDDYISRGAIDEFLKINQNVLAEIYCFKTMKKNSDGSSVFVSYKKYKEIKNGRDFLLFQYKNKSFQPEAWRNIYQRSFLIKNNCFFTNGILHEDDDWTPRTIINASKIFYSDFCAYIYVVRNNSIMKQQKYNRHIESIKYTIDQYNSVDYGFGKKLKRLVLDRMINNYISCFVKGQFYNNKQYYLPLSFFKGKVFFLRTRVKVLLFIINKKMLCKISYLFR